MPTKGRRAGLVGDAAAAVGAGPFLIGADVTSTEPIRDAAINLTASNTVVSLCTQCTSSSLANPVPSRTARRLASALATVQSRLCA